MLTFEIMVRTGNSGERFVRIYQAGKQEGMPRRLMWRGKHKQHLGVVEKKLAQNPKTT